MSSRCLIFKSLTRRPSLDPFFVSRHLAVNQARIVQTDIAVSQHDVICVAISLDTLCFY